jgi:hypothetical protein
MHKIQCCLLQGKPTSDKIDYAPANPVIIEDSLLLDRIHIAQAESLTE